MNSIKLDISKQKMVDSINKNSCGSIQQKFQAYDKARILYLVDRIQDIEDIRVQLKAADMIVRDFVKQKTPNIPYVELLNFDKAFNCAQAVNLTNAAKSGILPISAYYYFGKVGVDVTSVKKVKTYFCKISENQISELDKLVNTSIKSGIAIDGNDFSELVDSFIGNGKKSKSKSAAKKLESHLSSAISLAKSGKVKSHVIKLKLLSLTYALQAELSVEVLPELITETKKAVKKPSSKKAVVKK